ncbi:cytochrome P450 [Dendrothele bispora CBS 962.96]|uniref:Cytochrome P450 n=1 Tax=Dendrothele bispora (strain CBS 962.96) TaxID=1314807 RepID=A0A4S8LB03_DENBC|nr:cytochrome P450 [Dendrothele bispora CBS 962.96]
MYSTHLDEKIYPNAHTFDPWRFVNSSGKSDTGKAYTVTSAEFLSFDAGKHVCPGRFFAANELKAMLAHIVITYDVKFEAKANGVRPPNEYVGTSVIPNTTAHVLFCRRV